MHFLCRTEDILLPGAIVRKMCHCIACLQKKTNSHWSTRHVLIFWNDVCVVRGVIHLHLQVVSPVTFFRVTLRMSHSICQAPACLGHFASTVNVVFPFLFIPHLISMWHVRSNKRHNWCISTYRLWWVVEIKHCHVYNYIIQCLS